MSQRERMAKFLAALRDPSTRIYVSRRYGKPGRRLRCSISLDLIAKPDSGKFASIGAWKAEI